MMCLKCCIFRNLIKNSDILAFWNVLEEVTIRHYNHTIIRNRELFPIRLAQTVALSSNQITHMESCYMPYVYSLDLSCNQLTNISLLMRSTMLGIQFLNLSNNQITFLKREYFRHMSFLSQIDLSHNQFKQLPLVSLCEDADPRTYQPQIGYFSRFHTLDFSNNHLTYLHTSLFSHVIHLSILNLSSNLITGVESGSFYNLPKLITLDLSFNRLKTLSYDDVPSENGSVEHNCSSSIFRGLHNLENLNISHNNITYMSENSFCYLTQLKTLDLTGNYIQIFSHNAFKDLHNMVYLLLRDNSIMTIESSTFRSLYKVKHISLEDNHLTELDPDLFHGISNLVKLQLHNNNLVTVPLAVSKEIATGLDIFTIVMMFCVVQYHDLVHFVRSVLDSQLLLITFRGLLDIRS